MIKQIQLKGFERQKIEINTGGLIFRPALSQNGKVLTEGFWGNNFTLEKDDGVKVIGKWKSQLFGLDIPQLEVENVRYSIVDPLPMYVILWSGLPVLLGTRDLLWGTIFGLLGFSINLHAFHSEWKPWVKYLLTGAISVAWVAVFILFEPIFVFVPTFN
jgi:hypothetical protein